MKKNFLLIAIVASCFFISCKDKKVPAESVPDTVKTAFTTKYPGVTVDKWESEVKEGKTIYGADFKMDGKSKEAEFDGDGNFLKEK
jgi:uncharacterized membrane protein YkoI